MLAREHKLVGHGNLRKASNTPRIYVLGCSSNCEVAFGGFIDPTTIHTGTRSALSRVASLGMYLSSCDTTPLPLGRLAMPLSRCCVTTPQRNMLLPGLSVATMSKSP